MLRQVVVGWEVLLIEVQAVALGLEAKLLVQDHGGVVHRHVKGHVLTQARLDQVVQHQLPNARPGKVGVDHQEGDVGFVHLDVRGHEAAPHQELAVHSHHGEVGVLQTLCEVHGPEEVRDEGVDGREVVGLEVAQVHRATDVAGGGGEEGGPVVVGCAPPGRLPPNLGREFLHHPHLRRPEV